MWIRSFSTSMACSSFASTPKSNAKRVKLSHMTTSGQIKAMKDEIRSKIQSLRDQLDAKECELLDEVDRLGDLQVNCWEHNVYHFFIRFTSEFLFFYYFTLLEELRLKYTCRFYCSISIKIIVVYNLGE